MPSRNITKQQSPDSYYHVYNRGVNKQKIFLDSKDYKYFLGLFTRYLSAEPACDRMGAIYPHFLNQIEVLCYCLMTNHFHLLLYQHDVPALEKFMRSVLTSYSRYFNLKYKRTGPLFESRYKASVIDQDDYLQHITRYIHLNPRLWQTYRHSSLKYYRSSEQQMPVWLQPNKVLDMFDSRQEYIEFVADYEDPKGVSSELKWQLADT